MYFNLPRNDTSILPKVYCLELANVSVELQRAVLCGGSRWNVWALIYLRNMLYPFFWVISSAYESSRSRDGLHATAAIWAPAVTTPDPWASAPQENSAISTFEQKKKKKKKSTWKKSWSSLVTQQLRIWHCHCCGLGHCYGTGSIPGLGTAVGAAKKTKKTKKSYSISVI